MKFLGLIPARGGSKGIAHKNIALCGGKPLLAWTAEAALQVLDHVVLSTDDSSIADVGRSLGLDVPFIRPADIAADDTPMIDVLLHALDAFALDVDALVLLQPTSPLRCARNIREARDLFLARNPETVVSVVEVPHRFAPSSLMRLEAGNLTPYQSGGIGPIRRQDKVKLFARNGPAILIVRSQVVRRRELYGTPTLGYEMSTIESVDVDTMDDLRVADFLLRTASP